MPPSNGIWAKFWIVISREIKFNNKKYSSTFLFKKFRDKIFATPFFVRLIKNRHWGHVLCFWNGNLNPGTAASFFDCEKPKPPNRKIGEGMKIKMNDKVFGREKPTRGKQKHC